MYWWLLVEFICIYCGSDDDVQFLKSLTRGGAPNAHPPPANPRFQAASEFCVVDSKMQLCSWQPNRPLSIRRNRQPFPRISSSRHYLDLTDL